MTLRHLTLGRRATSRKAGAAYQSPPSAYWALDQAEAIRRLDTSPAGLSPTEAAKRLRDIGPNELRERRQLSRLNVLGRQLRSPLLLLLVFAAAASAGIGEWLDASIVLTIVTVTVTIGYSREYSAQSAVAAMRARIRVCSVSAPSVCDKSDRNFRIGAGALRSIAAFSAQRPSPESET